MRLPVLAMILLAHTAHADKFTHSAEVKPDVKLTDKSKPRPKNDTPPAPISGAQILKIAGLLGTIHTEQIGILKNELIPNTPDSEVDEKADLYFRLGEIYAKLNQFHRLKSAEAEIAAGKEKDARKKSALMAESCDHTAKAKQALVDAVTTYKKLVDNPIFVSSPKMDVAVFYFAYTLQSGGYIKDARDAYDKLLRVYPKSIYVPEAHLAFADSYYEQKQLADAEARYRMVLKFPNSSVYRYAQYKLGWVSFNLTKFPEAMEAFNEVVQATKNDPDKQVLHRAATTDFVRAYAEAGKADKALLAFKRVSGGDGLDMLETLADLYLDQGKSEKAIYVFRELMTQKPTSPKVCLWEHNVARAMLTAGTLDERVTEIERLVKLYSSTVKRLPQAEATECRDAAAEMSGEYARAYHQEGAKTKNADLLRIAGRLYRSYLAGFPGAPNYTETQYYHAELAWLFAEYETDQRRAVQKWSDAADAFTSALDAGKLSPKLVQVAADAAMLARMKALQVDPRVKQVPVDEKAYDTVAVPKPLPAAEAKLLAAYDGYLKYVKDPKDDERLDVMFHRANLLRRFDHHAESLPVLEELALKHPDHETAPWAAQLALDSYNRLKNYNGMFAFADKIPEKSIAKWPDVADNLKTLRRQGKRKKVEMLEAEAKRTGKLELYVECGNQYRAIYNDDPLAKDADELAYNAGFCYENGRSLTASWKMYELLPQYFPKSPHTAKSLARHGNVLASAAFYKEAAEKLEEYAKRFGGMADAYPALSDAVQFRKGIGDDAKAIEDTKLFVKMFGAKQQEKAAAAFFSMTAIYEKQGDLDKLAAHLRAYLQQFGATGGADRRVIAQAKLGEAMWKSSCPVATVDGTCMKMTRVASTARALRVRADGIPKRCGEETQAELTMVPRDARKVKLAADAFAAAIAEYEKAQPLGDKAFPNDARGALYHYAAARYGKVEREYEQYLAMQIPSNLNFDKRQPSLVEKSTKRFEGWFKGKLELGGKLAQSYQDVIALKDGTYAIASAQRLGALQQNFSAQLYRAEIPADQRTGPYAEETSQAYCETLEKLAEPLQVASEKSYEGCLSTSTRLGWFSDSSRACERELGQLKPDRYPKAFELRRAPDAAPITYELEKPPII